MKVCKPVIYLDNSSLCPVLPGMVRYPITAPQSQERPQRKRVRAAPLQTALAVDALEVAHQVHPEIAPGRHRGARPSWLRNKVGSSPRQRRRSRPRSAPTASGHKTHDPESAASPTSSPSGLPDHPSAVPSPSANPPANQGTRESDGADLINGLLPVLRPAHIPDGFPRFAALFRRWREPGRVADSIAADILDG